MKVCVFILTPGQTYFWQHILEKLESEGNEVLILARDYGETLSIMRERGITHTPFIPEKNSKMGKILSVPNDVLKAYQILRKWKPDVLLGYGFYEGCLGGLLHVPAITFTDLEPTVNKIHTFEHKLVKPFLSEYITPELFGCDVGPKHTRIPCLKEIAYLHPNYYQPDDSIYEILGLEKGTKYFLLRFNAFDSIHDVGHHGFSANEREEIFDYLAQYGEVLITSEIEDLPERMKSKVIRIPKSRFHDVLYYSSLVVTDAHTVAAEAALLGTYSIRSNSYVGENDSVAYRTLEGYGVMNNYSSFEDVMKRLREVVNDSEDTIDIQDNLNHLYDEMIAVVDYMCSKIHYHYDLSLKK